MPRIRTIKPALWDDEKLATCSLPARLVFVGCISQADDEGKLRAAASKIRSQLFSYDDFTVSDVDGWLLELHAARMIDLYVTSDGQRYARIPTWAKHQRINRFTPSELPDPSRSAPILERASEQVIHDTLTTDDVIVRTPSAPGREREREKEEEKPPPSAASTEPTVARQLFDWYCTEWGKAGQFAIDFTRKRQLAIEKALKLHDARTLAQSIQGHHDNPWRHESLNRNDIAVLMRPENIDVGREWFAKRKGAAPTTGAAPKQGQIDMGYEY